MRTIRPLSAQDCIKLINNHKTEILKGEIEFQIEKDWLSHFDESILIFFAQHGTFINKVLLISYHQIPLKVLDLLAKDNDATIRQKVASLSMTPKNILQSLSKDQSPWVRVAIASNHNTPPEILILLVNDINEITYSSGYKTSPRQEALSNPNMPQDILREFATDADDSTRLHIARNPNTPKDVLELLARTDPISVISNPNTPISIIRLLKEASSPIIRERAEEALRKRNSCFIATEVYGSPLDVNVLTLKEFRDATLMTSCWGKLFVTYYYQISPSIAYLLSKNKLLRIIIKYGMLNPIVWIIKLIKHPTE